MRIRHRDPGAQLGLGWRRRRSDRALSDPDPGATEALQGQPGPGRGRKPGSLTSTLKHCSAPQTATHKIHSKVCRKAAPECCTEASRLPEPRASTVIADCAPAHAPAPAPPSPPPSLPPSPFPFQNSWWEGARRFTAAGAGLRSAARSSAAGQRRPTITIVSESRPGPAQRPARASCSACALLAAASCSSSCGRATAPSSSLSLSVPPLPLPPERSSVIYITPPPVFLRVRWLLVSARTRAQQYTHLHTSTYTPARAHHTHISQERTHVCTPALTARRACCSGDGWERSLYCAAPWRQPAGRKGRGWGPGPEQTPTPSAAGRPCHLAHPAEAPEAQAPVLLGTPGALGNGPPGPGHDHRVHPTARRWGR